jgi:hypothetical protein
MLAAVFFAALFSGKVAVAQAGATASEELRLSAFGGISGTYTDVFGGHNLSVTAGGNVSLRRFLGVNPSAEIRGTIPFVSGHFAGLDSLLGGVKLERPFGRFHPYGDMLFGRGAMNWQNGGLPSGNVILIKTVSPVFSPGVGVDMDVKGKWVAKADFQYQFWTNYPPVPGTPHPKVLTAGVQYRFDFNHRH